MAQLRRQTLTGKEQSLYALVPDKNAVKEFVGVKRKFTSIKEGEEFIQELSKQFLNDYFGESLDIPVIVNTRMRRNLGLFHSTHEVNKKGVVITTPEKISINSLYFKFEQTDLARVVSTLYHELVHYVLCKKGLRYNDEDLIFDSILNKLSIETNYSPMLYGDIVRDYDLYRCSCGNWNGIFDGVKSYRLVLKYDMCEKCKNNPAFVRKEIGVYSEITQVFINESKEIFAMV